MSDLGISRKGIKTALEIKETYKRKDPILVPGEDTRILQPEILMNHHIDLTCLEDPLPLAVMATKDPESPMALAAAVRMAPLGLETELVNGVVRIVGETSKHPLVKKCIEMVTDADFDPGAIADVERAASRIIVKTRKQYTAALRQNLQGLLDGAVAPRQFVREFFQLTEAGNLRHDIRNRLVLNLMLSERVRPSIKFLMLENFERFPIAVRRSIIEGVFDAPRGHHIDIIREELKYIIQNDKSLGFVH